VGLTEKCNKVIGCKELEYLKLQLRELEAVLENCRDGISIVDKHGVILRSNSAMQKLYRLSVDDYVGKSISELVANGTFNIDVSSKVIPSGQSVSVLQDISTGTRCLTTGAPIFGDDGQVEMVVVTSHDVTELYALKERLKKSQNVASGYQSELTDLRVAQMQKEDIVVRNKKMLDILDLAGKLATVDTTVLITGESGVGKEVVTTILHRASPRRSRKSFIKINCGAIPRELLEAELFGYEHGAFTGAAREGKPGLFEMADGGSIFLDEIGELPLDLQVKLLRVIQEREFSRIGGSKVMKVDVRVIAASNKDLLELVNNNLFRKDLYYRLSVVPVNVPPLRERKEDIMALAQHYVRYFNRKYGFEKVMSAELIDVMESYGWPGNVRELMNVVERMVVTSKGNILGAEEFPVDNSAPRVHNLLSGYISKDTNLERIIEETERLIIIETLQKSKNITIAAKELGVSRSTLTRKMRKHGIKSRQ